MPVVNGSNGNDFIHRAGDGRSVPAGHADISGVTTGNDTIYGLGGNDYLFGDLGNDTLNGGTGADRMDGGAGNDWFYVDAAADTVIELADGGTDRILSSVSYALAAGAHVEILTTTNTAGTTALNLTGNSFVQTIHGNAGVNTLNGGGGADTLVGFAGNDFYYVDTAADIVTEAAGGGLDRVFTTVSYALNASTQVEILSASVAAATTAINLTGNGFAQTLTGNAGANILNGGGGADTMIGYGGNDWYYVDNAGDQVTEGASGGFSDRILASVSYALAAAAQIEILTTTNTAGTGAINLTGNDFSQHILGNAGHNILDGRGGNDILNGSGGHDILIGGPGIDALNGQDGHDVYIVATGADHGAAEFADTESGFYENEVRFTSTIADDTLVLYAGDTGIERIVIGTGLAGTGLGGGADTTGTTALNVNAAALGYGVSINGNAGDNILTGGSGNDGLNGGPGSDSLYGGAGNDVLSSYGDGDLLVGGAGDDTYYIHSAGNTVVENIGEGIEYLETTLDFYVLPANVENGAPVSVFYGTMYGNELDNNISFQWSQGGYLYGQGGNDTLTAGNGNLVGYNYQLYGGSGNDILRGADFADVLQGDSGADNLWGGGFSDRFVFVSWQDSTIASFDTIHDFVSGGVPQISDGIDLSAIDAIYNPDVRANEAFTYVAFGTGVAGQIWWVTSSSVPGLYVVYADVDGGGADIRIDVVTDSLSVNDFSF
ncbi:calcium-binding protein [Sphingomonas sp.]|uniref:calcium-binding protein n=1 Tax=Sphingomonas sp. TaxID=28214 RepID=UPI00286D6EB1|nr:calcium-binding protein [Sphingomonas sp.]